MKHPVHYRTYQFKLSLSDTLSGILLATPNKNDDLYFKLLHGSLDTSVPLSAALPDTLMVPLYSIEMDSTKEVGHLGSGEDEFGCPSDIAMGASAGGLRRYFICDPCLHRVVAYNDSMRILYTYANRRIESPISIVSLPSGRTAVFCNIARKIFSLNNDGSIHDSILNNVSPLLSSHVKLKSGSNMSILCIDTDNDRVLLISSTGNILGEYVKAMGKFLNHPSDAVSTADGILILDKGNKRIVEISRSGSGIRELSSGFIDSTKLIVEWQKGFLLFESSGNVDFLDKSLRWVDRKKLSRFYDAGVISSGGHLLLVSSMGRSVCEFHIRLKRVGEARGIYSAPGNWNTK